MHLSTRALWLAAIVLALGTVGQWAGAQWATLWRYPAAALLLLLALEGLLGRLQPLPLQWFIPAVARLGQSLQQRGRLANPSHRVLHLDAFLPPPEGLDAAAAVQRLAVPGRGEATLVLAGIPTRLGLLHWGPVELRLRGRFGLAWWSRRLRDDVPPTRLVPDSLGAENPGLGSSAQGGASARRRGQGQELLGLREYGPGDPPRSIDWKASARRGLPMVRELGEDLHLELILLLDVGRASAAQIGTLSRLHRSVNAAARLAELATGEGDRVGLLTYAQNVQLQLPGLQGVSGLRRLRTALATLRPLPHESNPLVAALAMQRLARQRSLVVWFADLEDAEAAGQLARAVQLLTPKHLPLLAALHDPELNAQPLRAARHWEDPYTAYAALQSQAAIDAAARRLERLGCQVLSARPEQLDAALSARYRQLRARRSV